MLHAEFLARLPTMLSEPFLEMDMTTRNLCCFIDSLLNWPSYNSTHRTTNCYREWTYTGSQYPSLLMIKNALLVGECTYHTYTVWYTTYMTMPACITQYIYLLLWKKSFWTQFILSWINLFVMYSWNWRINRWSLYAIFCSSNRHWLLGHMHTPLMQHMYIGLHLRTNSIMF